MESGLAGRVRPITAGHNIATNEALLAAPEAIYDATEAVTCSADGT